MSLLAGKLVVVTGASRGIGAATALAFAKEGAKVCLLARTLSDLEVQVGLIEEAGGKGIAYPVDLSDGKAATTIAQEILEKEGVPDILVNNAGLGRWLFVEETPHEEAETMVKLPYLAAFWMTSAFMPGMIERGSGRILNVNSPVSIFTWGGAAGYASARWALRGFTTSLWIDLHGTGVTACHCIFGEVSSSYFETNEGTAERLPLISKLMRPMTPEQVARSLVKAGKHKRKSVASPWLIALGIRLNSIAPTWFRWTMRRMSYRREQSNRTSSQ